MVEGGHETRNVVAPRTWEQPSADSQQGSGYHSRNKGQGAADNQDEREKDSSLEPWKEIQPC